LWRFVDGARGHFAGADIPMLHLRNAADFILATCFRPAPRRDTN
jgi:hypothetical protein